MFKKKKLTVNQFIELINNSESKTIIKKFKNSNYCIIILQLTNSFFTITAERVFFTDRNYKVKISYEDYRRRIYENPNIRNGTELPVTSDGLEHRFSPTEVTDHFYSEKIDCVITETYEEVINSKILKIGRIKSRINQCFSENNFGYLIKDEGKQGKLISLANSFKI